MEEEDEDAHGADRQIDIRSRSTDRYEEHNDFKEEMIDFKEGKIVLRRHDKSVTVVWLENDDGGGVAGERQRWWRGWRTATVMAWMENGDGAGVA
ncbi:hypothetical protein L6452_32968 [Arctium lappa]|uniref:Uncharacterized protein n=1 Tax=Arctium lappa TaxID=4217 RepID=A0ACB8Z704_ARCLA|nr:hypothetical protein L6452_32968 [Arctium lappa]